MLAWNFFYSSQQALKFIKLLGAPAAIRVNGIGSGGAHCRAAEKCAHFPMCAASCNLGANFQCRYWELKFTVLPRTRS